LPRSKKATYDRNIRCLAGTRKLIINQIYEWIDSKENGNNVFWLCGPPGSGKSTVASEVAVSLDTREDGLEQLGLGDLGATFFCKRNDNTLNQPSLVFSTIAFRLAHVYPPLKRPILTALDRNPDAGEMPTKNQFENLIVDPLSSLPADLDVPPIVVIVDALDECGDEDIREPLLECLARISRLPIWFKVLVTSRPERDIRKYLGQLANVHEVNTSGEDSTSDIRAYTEDQVTTLRRDRQLGSDWPGSEKINELVSHAGGLFIWTRLSFDFIARQPSPKKALNLVLAPTDRGRLDALYRTVLIENLVEAEQMELICSVLGCVVTAKIPLTLSCLCAFLALLDIEKEEVEWAVGKLASVIPMDSSSVVHVIHPSFLDFLTDRKRSKEFFIDAVEQNLLFARATLQIMDSKLHTNICHLTNPSLLNREISDLSTRLASHVPEELSYSCQFWTEHLKGSSNKDPDLCQLFDDFVRNHFFHWLEVMSLMGEASNAVVATHNAKSWLSVSDIFD